MHFGALNVCSRMWFTIKQGCVHFKKIWKKWVVLDPSASPFGSSLRDRTAVMNKRCYASVRFQVFIQAIVQVCSVPFISALYYEQQKVCPFSFLILKLRETHRRPVGYYMMAACAHPVPLMPDAFQCSLMYLKAAVLLNCNLDSRDNCCQL